MLLGMLYYKGEDVEQNYAEASQWFKQAAEVGHPEAMFMLGLLYLNELHLYPQAFHWNYQAAHKGLPAAQYNLAYQYQHGIGTTQNPTESLVWYQRCRDLTHGTLQQEAESALRTLEINASTS
ncbi:MAG: sel1 repeat family protein [Chloroflexi bacterium]|nr:sel1 repeat family protein [Chloroflexota bacterium]